MSISHSSPQPTSSITESDSALISPPSQSSFPSSPDLALSLNSSTSTFGEYLGSAALASSSHRQTSKTFVPGRCHCGLNSFIAVFPKPKKHDDPNIAQNHSYPSSSASVSSQLNLAALNKSSSSIAESTSSEVEPSLPILNDLCHCNTCRHTSGQMAVYHVSMLGPPLASASLNASHTRDSLQLSQPLSSNDSQLRIAPPSARARVKKHSPYLGLGSGMGRIRHGLCGEGNDASGLISALNAVTENDGLDRALDEGSGDDDPDSESEWERPFDVSGLSEYRTSRDVTRLFCKSCSAQLFFVYTSSPDETLANSTVKSRQRWKWCVAGGALARTAGIVKLDHHIWVGDTFDGGMADHLQVVDGVTMARYREGVKSDQVELGWRKALLKEVQSLPLLTRKPRPHHSGASERLPLYCHCGSICLLVTRPTFESTMLSAPFPDIICPSDSRLSKRRNPRDLKWWLRPPLGHPVPSNTDPEKNATHATRYLAGHCMCSTCRLTSGMEVQSWLWIPNCNVLDARTGNPIVLDHAVEAPSTSATPLTSVSAPELQRRPRAGASSPTKSILSDGSSSPKFTASPASSGRSSPAQQEPAGDDIDEALYLPSGRLKALNQYTPSPGRYRESCSKCGANILLWSTQVPDILCVSAGLIDENYGHGGARAEAWFDWYTERVGFMEDALHDTGLGHRGSAYSLSHSKGDGIGCPSSLKATAEGLVAGLAKLKKESDDELRQKTVG